MPEKDTLIFGRHPIVDAIQSGAQVDRLYLQQGIRGDFEKEIRQLSRQHDIPLQYVPKERLSKITKGNHQGIVGYLSLLTYHRLDNLVPTLFEKQETPIILLLDGVTDVGNFGAIARSAEVCGAQALVVPKSGTALINADAMKASAGALARIPVCRENSLVTAVEYLQLSGIQTYAGDLRASKFIYELDLTPPVALVVGSEGEGVQPAILKRVAERFVLPQKGATDSLNVSVAAGVMLYEVLRQRMGGKFH